MDMMDGAGRLQDLIAGKSAENYKPGARDWIRTSTSLRMLPPEDSASTNFATRAFKGLQYYMISSF